MKSVAWFLSGCLLALIGDGSAAAEPRSQTIDEIVRIQKNVDLQLFRRVLPQYAKSEARKLVVQLGKQGELGPEWKPGDRHWDSALQTLETDRMRAFDPGAARDVQEEANYRESLGQLSDAQLEEVATFYKSELFGKVVRNLDGTLTLLFGLLSRIGTASTGAEEKGTFDEKQLERQVEKYKLTDDEQQRLNKVLTSPTFQILNRGTRSRLIGAFSSATSLMNVPPTEETITVIRSIVADFRATHRLPPPLPPSHPADFIYKPAEEKVLRDLSNQAMRGDASALSRIKGEAEAGNPIAQAELGRLYSLGIGIEKNSEAALEWTRKSAQQQFPRAMFNLAVQLELGQGVAQNMSEAVSYYKQAADRGFARAQLALGLMYRQGRGVPQDFQQSLVLIRKAAEQELPAAELAMAEIYDSGAGVPMDQAAASIWLGRATRHGYSPAIDYRASRARKRDELTQLVQGSPPSARASATAADKPELNRRLLDAVKRINISYVGDLLDAGADPEARDVRPNEGETALHHAARTGNVELASVLIAKGANVNAAAPSGFTPLHVAAGLNRETMVRFLLKSGANPNALDSRGTPLHAATIQGNGTIVAILLDNGADPNARDKSGNTPLHALRLLATYYPTHTEIIKRLADSGADLFALQGKAPYANTAFMGPLTYSEDAAIAIVQSRAKLVSDNAEATPLPLALAGRGYLNALRMLEQKGVSLDVMDSKGETPLHWAAGAGQEQTAAYLLSRGLKVDTQNLQGQTPLMRATANGNVDMVAFLLDRGANIEARNSKGQTSLIISIYSWRDGKVARLLLSRKASAHVRDADGRSVLDWAAGASASTEPLELILAAGVAAGERDSMNRTALHKVRLSMSAQVLIDRAADVNWRDDLGMSPLFYAAELDSAADDVLVALLAAGAKTDFVAKDGSTPVYHAVRNVKGLQLLLDRRAGTVQDRDADGRTPLHWAAEKGHRGTIELLLRRGAAVNAQTATGDTPLHFAVRAKHLDNIRAILQGGGNPKLANARGETAFSLAEAMQNESILKALRN